MDSFDQIADKIGELCPELKGDIQKSRENLARLKQERDDLVKKMPSRWQMLASTPRLSRLSENYSEICNENSQAKYRNR